MNRPVSVCVCVCVSVCVCVCVLVGLPSYCWLKGRKGILTNRSTQVSSSSSSSSFPPSLLLFPCGDIETGRGVGGVVAVVYLSVSRVASAAASGRGVYRLALDLHVGLLRGSGRGPGAHPLLDLGRHGHEGLLHVGGALGARLQERDAQGVGEFLASGKN